MREQDTRAFKFIAKLFQLLKDGKSRKHGTFQLIMSFWANYSSSILQTEPVCYLVAIVVINATTTPNKKSFSASPYNVNSYH